MHTLENILFQALKTILGLETVVLSFHRRLTWTSMDADVGLCSLPGAALPIGVIEGSWGPEPYFLFYLRGSLGPSGVFRGLGRVPALCSAAGEQVLEKEIALDDGAGKPGQGRLFSSRAGRHKGGEIHARR